jgi:tetratricopeptide (TPR) repeat protein
LLKACYELGSVEKELGKLTEARAKFRRALAIMEDYPAFRKRETVFVDSLEYVAQISEELGDHLEAANVSRALADLSPKNEPYQWYCLLRLARCDFAQGRYEIALAEAERVAGSTVASEEDREWARTWIPSVRWRLAELRYDAKDYSACIAECERLLSAWGPGHEGRPSVLLLLGHSRLFRKEKPAAKTCYEETLACENATPEQRACATKYLAMCG